MLGEYMGRVKSREARYGDDRREAGCWDGKATGASLEQGEEVRVAEGLSRRIQTRIGYTSLKNSDS